MSHSTLSEYRGYSHEPHLQGRDNTPTTHLSPQQEAHFIKAQSLHRQNISPLRVPLKNVQSSHNSTFEYHSRSSHSSGLNGVESISPHIRSDSHKLHSDSYSNHFMMHHQNQPEKNSHNDSLQPQKSNGTHTNHSASRKRDATPSKSHYRTSVHNHPSTFSPTPEERLLASQSIDESMPNSFNSFSPNLSTSIQRDSLSNSILSPKPKDNFNHQYNQGKNQLHNRLFGSLAFNRDS